METDERVANQRAELMDAINGLDAAVSVTVLLRKMQLTHHDHAAVVMCAQALLDDGLIGRIRVGAPTGSYDGYFPLHLLPRTAAQPEEKLDDDMAARLIERLEKDLAPTPLVERRVPERRNLTVLDVVARWRLPYPLGRVVEVVFESRRAGLTRENAALAIKLLRAHARGDE